VELYQAIFNPLSNSTKRDTGVSPLPQESKAALISVHPKYVRQILDGSKKIEFRRVWATRPITHLVLYSTAPDMKVVAILQVKKTIETNVSGLWELAKQYGGGLTRATLREYFSNKPRGYGLIIGSVQALKTPLALSAAIPSVRAPQSYAYLTSDQFAAIQKIAGGGA
jgi:predicted transcriptional regulator